MTPKRGTAGVWIDFDEAFDMWGVYDIDSGFCFVLVYTEQEAKDWLRDRV